MPTVTLTTGLSVSLLGTISIPATSVDLNASTITLQWDVSQHLAGNTAVMSMSSDLSLDGGLTWSPLLSAGRDQGYDLISGKTTASVSMSMPGIGNSLRMVRASLIVTGSSVVTSGQVIMS